MLLPLLAGAAITLAVVCCAGGGVVGVWLLGIAQRPAGPPIALSSSDAADSPDEQPVAPATKPEQRPQQPVEEKKPVSYWVAVLKENDPARVEQARQQLVQMGALAVPELRRALRDPDVGLRQTVLAVLADMGDLAFEAAGDVAAALNDREAVVRVSAARTLGRMGKPGRAGLPALVAATADPNGDVREAVADTLQRFTPLVPDDAPRLAPLLSSGPPERRSTLITVLRTLKPDAETAVTLFGPLLHDPNKKLRLEALAAVAEAGKSARPLALPKLFPLMDDGDSDVRTAAAAGVMLLGPPVADDLPLLKEGLRGREAESRRYCADALAALGPAAADAVPHLARALSDRDAPVRASALTALLKIGPPALDVLGSVLPLRTDADPAVRRGVIKLLRLAGRRPNVFESLVAALSDSDAGVRAAAVEALKALKPPPGKDDVMVFNTGLKSEHVDVRRYAAGELERLGIDSQLVLVTMIDAIRDPDPQVRKSVYGALAAIGPKAKLAAPALVEEMTAALTGDLKDAPTAERFRRAAFVLGQIGETAQAVPLLQQGLRSTDAHVRNESLTAVGAIGLAAKELIPDLSALLSNTDSRGSAATALSKFGKAAVPELVNVLEKSPREAKMGAIKALELMPAREARDATTALYKLAREYRGTELGNSARTLLANISAGKKD